MEHFPDLFLVHFSCKHICVHAVDFVCSIYQEREERRKRLKRERSDDRPVHVSQPLAYDSFQAKFAKVDTSRLPSGKLYFRILCGIVVIIPANIFSFPWIALYSGVLYVTIVSVLM